MSKLNQRYDTVQCINPLGFHRMRYCCYGNPERPIVMAVHGLTRLSADFHPLAEQLASDFFVICPDIVGRGQSDWLPEGVAYTYSQYLQDLNVLFNVLKQRHPHTAKGLSFLGTSMGGLLGMILASFKHTPINKLIINDVGPFVSYTWLHKIRDAYQQTPLLKDFDSARAYICQAYASFGELTDEQWTFMTHITTNRNADGSYRLHYDPRIIDYKIGDEQAPPRSDTEAPPRETGGANFWGYWTALSCPILTIRGAHSKLLDADLLATMQQTKPAMTTYTVADAGHAPALFDDDSKQFIRQWLLH